MANSFIKIDGAKDIERALGKLPSELAMSVERTVLREGMKPVRVAAIAHARKSKDSGLLAESIGLSVRKTRKKGNYQNLFTARVGPRGGFRKMVTRRRKGKSGGNSSSISFREEMADPRNYAHLVEYGTSHSPAKPFIRPAVASAQSQILSGMSKGYSIGLTRITKKIRKKK